MTSWAQRRGKCDSDAERSGSAPCLAEPEQARAG